MARTAKILIADDDEAILRILVRYARRWGYEASTAADGIHALESVARDRPDLVLLDISMPGKDGLTVLQELAASYPGMPVIMITGDLDQEMAKRCLSSGAVDYITKPLDFDCLETSVKSKVSRSL